LPPTEIWNKGDFRKSGKSNYTFSNFTILPNPEPDQFKDKLRKLLDHLEQDKDGIKQLVNNANGHIQVAMDFHNGNGMIGGPSIDSIDIKRMSELGLSIDFDLYVSGNKFKE
jgi:heme oxygenase